MGAHSRPDEPGTDTATVVDRETTDRLYQITLDGMCDTSGDVEAPTGWFALVPDGDAWYLIIQDILGFNHGYRMGSEVHARTVYAELDDEYSKWLGQECPAGSEV